MIDALNDGLDSLEISGFRGEITAATTQQCVHI